jgi:hypothetical protein
MIAKRVRNNKGFTIIRVRNIREFAKNQSLQRIRVCEKTGFAKKQGAKKQGLQDSAKKGIVQNRDCVKNKQGLQKNRVFKKQGSQKNRIRKKKVLKDSQIFDFFLFV